MKAKAILVSLILLSLLILAVNPLMAQSSFEKNRSWRVNEINYENDNDQNGVYDDFSKEVVYYHDETSSRIDSIQTYVWDTMNSEWSLHMKRLFVYDTTGEYVIENHYYDYQQNQTIHKLYYDYNSQNRLIRYRYYYYNANTLDYTLYMRCYFLYGPDRLNQIIQSTYLTSSNYYKKDTYTHDTQGRIITNMVSSSSDSLSWSNSYLIHNSYHPNDTTTSEQYIQHLAHYYPNNNMFGTVFFDMLAESYFYQDWNGNDWDEQSRTVFNYNTQNQLTDYINQDFDSSWINSMKYEYSYDTSNNLYQIYATFWSISANNWNYPYSKRTYTWQQTTSNQDDYLELPEFDFAVYPNPFSKSVNINLNTKNNASVKLNVFNIKGQLVKSAVFDAKSFTWDGTDNQNHPVSEGVYIIKASQDGISASRKIIKINH